MELTVKTMGIYIYWLQEKENCQKIVNQFYFERQDKNPLLHQLKYENSKLLPYHQRKIIVIEISYPKRDKVVKIKSSNNFNLFLVRKLLHKFS